MLVFQQEQEPLRSYIDRMLKALYGHNFAFVEGSYNGFPLRVDLHSTVDSVFEQYGRKFQESIKEGYTPEAQYQSPLDTTEPEQATVQEDTDTLQLHVDALTGRLTRLDLSDINLAMSWLDKFIPFTLDPNVDLSRHYVVERFQSFGYTMSHYETPSKDTLGAWIISQCIKMLDDTGTIGRIQAGWVARWLVLQQVKA